MPFITEEIWQAMYEGQPPLKSIALAAYPQAEEKQFDLAAETEMAILQDLIVNVRNVRAELKVEPKVKVPIEVFAHEPGIRAMIEQNRGAVERLANVEKITFVDSSLAKQAGARSTARFDVHVIYERKIDVAAERERLNKELEKIEKEFANNQRQLGNEQFLAKAPEKVVEGLRRRAAGTDRPARKDKAVSWTELNGTGNQMARNWQLNPLITGLAMDFNSRRITAILENALLEDRATRDATSYACIDPNQRASATILAKQDCILAGIGCVGRILDVYAALDGAVTSHYEVTTHPEIFDGVRLHKGQSVAVIRHNARVILSCERVILNFLQRMSGIATLTRKFVDAVSGTKARILDTRKTAPGLRVIDKYAVRCGGGQNHRLDLSDGVLIKNNHIALAGGIVPALERALRNRRGSQPIEVEVRTIEELEAGAGHGAEAILLDNMPPEDVRRAVERCCQSGAPRSARMLRRNPAGKCSRLRRDRRGFHFRRPADPLAASRRYEPASCAGLDERSFSPILSPSQQSLFVLFSATPA